MLTYGSRGLSYGMDIPYILTKCILIQADTSCKMFVVYQVYESYQGEQTTSIIMRMHNTQHY